MRSVTVRAQWPTYALVIGVGLVVWGLSGYSPRWGLPLDARIALVIGVILAGVGVVNRRHGP